MHIMNIYQRLNAIKEEVGYVQKDKVVGTYRAVTHDQVTAYTRPHFVKHGVIIIPVELESKTILTTMLTGKGLPIIRFEAKYSVRFISIYEEHGSVSVDLTAHAIDSGDKAPGKALSYATKYAILKVLQLETGEDDEGRIAVEAPLPVVDIEKHQQSIAGAADLKSLQAVWKLIIADCNAAKDTVAYNDLKVKVTSRKAILSKEA